MHHIWRHLSFCVIGGDIHQISPFTKYKYLCIISTLLIGVLHWDPVSILFSNQLLLSDSTHWEASAESITIWWFSVSVIPIQTTETFSTSAIKLFYFLITCVFTELALFISFKNFSLTFTTCLTDWCKRSSFQPVSAFNMLSPLSSIISSFWFKVRYVTLSFTWTLRSHCRVIN